MIVRNFLDANGFMHINEAKTSWGRTRNLEGSSRFIVILFNSV